MPKGLKPVTRTLSSGEVRVYWYHRATGRRLEHDPETADGLLEVSALDARAKSVAVAIAFPRASLAALWVAYLQSPEFTGLKPRTQADYQAVRSWIGPGAEKAVVKLITGPQILALRDKAAAAKGRRFGNYVLQVLRLVLQWGVERGWRTGNPAMGLKQIRKPKGEGNLNRAWREDEVEAFARTAPAQLLVPFVLGLFAAMRQGDMLRIGWPSYNGLVLRWIAGKNDEPCTAPATGLFKTILDVAHLAWKGRVREAAAEQALVPMQICVSSRGVAWTESGFRASFFKHIAKLEAAGQLRPGCTFQGLRHTVATFARDGEESEFRIASAIGDRSTAMAGVYGRDADRARAQSAVLSDVQARFKNSGWKTPLENASRAAPRRPSKPLKR